MSNDQRPQPLLDSRAAQSAGWQIWRPHFHRPTAGRLFLVALSAVALTFVSPLSGCGRTGGEEVLFQFGVAAIPGDDGVAGEFTTSTGWAVKLSTGAVVVGPIYLHEEHDEHDDGHDDHEHDDHSDHDHQHGNLWRRGIEFRPTLHRLASLIVRPAHAHPGDDDSAVVGEWLEQVVVDVLKPGVHILGETIGDRAGVESFTVHLDPPRQALNEEEDVTRGFTVYVEGEARKGEELIRFRGGLDLPAADRRIEELPAHVHLDEGGVFVLEIDPSAWFDHVPFDELLDQAAEDGVYVLTELDTVREAWIAGVTSPNAFEARWLSEGRDE